MQLHENFEKQERTKRRLQEAFMQLYKKTPLERIAVRQIAELAGVTRSTFYVYYDSVYGILEAIENELQEGMGKYFEKYSEDMLERGEEGGPLADYGALEPYESNIKWFEYCRQHRDYLLILLGPHGDPSFEYKLRKNLKVDINRMMDEDGMLNDYLRDYFVEYVVGATLSLMRYWLERADLSAEEVVIVVNMIRQSKLVVNQMHSKSSDGENHKK